ncbi:MAG: replication-relaxation family protein [Thermoanaerobaculia bacterium]
MSELHAAIFTSRHPSVISRSLKRLRRCGWITTWDEPSPGGGGNRRWAVPTARSLRWTSATLRASCAGQSWERVADLMLPGSRNHELKFTRGRTPPFLMHQRDVNRLCLSFRATLEKRLLWFSAFDRPFPNRVNGIAMPQPDFVLVVAGDRGPELVFGEHDRGSESLAHFREAKVERYAELASLPSFCRDILGFATFRVLVTVMDPFNRRPHDRIAMLGELVSAARRAELFAIHLAGKVHAHPGVVCEHSHVAHDSVLTPTLSP